MKAVQIEQVGTTQDGARVVKAFIVADKAPATLPTTGSGVVGMNDTDVFAPFSIIYVTATTAAHKVYIAGEKGVFVPQ